jgi:predicted metalloprotease with PDZ domain
VAAWRELARRLAHELKNPLFPLQLTVENLVRARQQNPRAVRRSFSGEFENTLGGDFESQGNHRKIQRVFEDAAAAVAARAGE